MLIPLIATAPRLIDRLILDYRPTALDLVPQDGPDGWYVPASPADFSALGLAAPDYLWLCQEASGDLSTSIGPALPLVANATGHLYQQSVTGWTRKFLGTDGSTAAQSWRTSSALLDLANGESRAMLMLASITVPAATTRMLMSAGGGVNNLNFSAPDGFLRTSHNSVLANGDVAQGDLATVHQFVWYRNATTNASGALSNTDDVTGTHNEAAQTGAVKGIGACTGSNITPVARVGWFAIYKGANAEQDWPTYLATLRGE